MRELATEAARMFAVGFDGVSMPRALPQLLARGVSSVILFARNIETPRQVAQLCGELKSRSSKPLLTCIDQEGGRVRRLRDGFTHVPSMRARGQREDGELAGAGGKVLGGELGGVNVGVNF